MGFNSSFFFQITSGALSDMIDPSDRKTSEFALVGLTIGNEIEGVYHSSNWPAESASLQLSFFFFFLKHLPSIRRSRSRALNRNSLRRMKLQTAANKENNFDLEEDEDQGESEDYDGEGFISQSR